jgi:hypothetical protein
LANFFSPVFGVNTTVKEYLQRVVRAVKNIFAQLNLTDTCLHAETLIFVLVWPLSSHDITLELLVPELS